MTDRYPADAVNTEPAQARESLPDSRQMLELVMENVPLGVFWKDRNSVYLGCNRVVCETLGLENQSQLIGKTDREFPSLTREQAESFLQLDRQVMETDTPLPPTIEPLNRFDGSTRLLETIKVPLHNAQGRVIGILGTWQDVTERIQNEEAIAKYVERLRILHQIDKALIAGESLEAIAAAALPPFRELLGVARAIVNLFDLEKGEVEWLAAAGRHRVHVGPGIRYPIQLMGSVESLRKGETQFIDVDALPPSPEVGALLESGIQTYAVVPMIAGGELIGSISFGGGSDSISSEQISIAQEVAAQFAIALTQAQLDERIRRQAEELEVRVLERTRELEMAHAALQKTNLELTQSAANLRAVNQELDAFSYSVSHDLRAPLRAIDGFSRILLTEHAANMTVDAQEFLRDIRRNARQMGLLVDDLLNLSRLGRQPVKRQPLEPASLVCQCLEELRRQHEGRKVELRIGELPTCWADPALLTQVWMNLISNAFKYTSKRETAIVEIGSRRDDASGRQTYFIQDNGVGFDMRYVHKLFGVFQRLHRAEDYEGTGVGLAIVQRIVHRHGGQVWAEAQQDRGATFFFNLEERQESHD